jgi:hypothetical protein
VTAKVEAHQYQVEQEGFLELSEKEYGDLLADFERIQNLLLESIEKSRVVLENEPQTDKQFLRAYLYLSEKAVNFAVAVLTLCKRGLAVPSLVLLRTLHHDHLTIRYLFYERGKLDLWFKEDDIEERGGKPLKEFRRTFREGEMAKYLEKRGQTTKHEVLASLNKLVHSSPLAAEYVGRYGLMRLDRSGFHDILVATIWQVYFYLLMFITVFLEEMKKIGKNEPEIAELRDKYYGKLIAYRDIFIANQKAKEVLKEGSLEYLKIIERNREAWRRLADK